MSPGPGGRPVSPGSERHNLSTRSGGDIFGIGGGGYTHGSHEGHDLSRTTSGQLLNIGGAMMMGPRPQSPGKDRPKSPGGSTLIMAAVPPTNTNLLYSSMANLASMPTPTSIAIQNVVHANRVDGFTRTMGMGGHTNTALNNTTAAL